MRVGGYIGTAIAPSQCTAWTAKRVCTCSRKSRISSMVRTGRLHSVIDETFPLERAPEALARLEQRQVFGKLVITP